MELCSGIGLGFLVVSINSPLDLHSHPLKFTQVFSLSLHWTYTHVHLNSLKSFHPHSNWLTLSSISFHSSPFTLIPLDLHSPPSHFIQILSLSLQWAYIEHPPHFSEVLSFSLHWTYIHIHLISFKSFHSHSIGFTFTCTPQSNQIHSLAPHSTTITFT
jgi:hypothetical protein